MQVPYLIILLEELWFIDYSLPGLNAVLTHPHLSVSPVPISSLQGPCDAVRGPVL